ncbi:hypothetical protein QP028_12930 [Corynebacterium suedekumii]|nr:hypothetical protein QP028_12930 [Corynebacterium suedekumii]
MKRVDTADELGPGEGLGVGVLAVGDHARRDGGVRVEILLEDVDEEVLVAVVTRLELLDGPLADGDAGTALTDGTDEHCDLHGDPSIR